MTPEKMETLPYAEAEYIDSGTFQAGEEDCSRAGLTRRDVEAAVVNLAQLRALVEAARELHHFFGLPRQAQAERLEWLEEALSPFQSVAKEAK